MIIDEDSVVQPDLVVIRKEHLSIIRPEGLRGAPDLVVEVLSPSTVTETEGSRGACIAAMACRSVGWSTRKSVLSK